MATFTVTTVNDTVNAGDGMLSLREAVAQANASAAADTIVFANGIEGQTLVLTNGELVVTKDLTIDGNKNSDGTAITISADDTSRIVNVVGAQVDATFRDLTFRDGFVGGVFSSKSGGAILSDEASVKIYNSTFASNGAYYFREGSTGRYRDGGRFFTH